MCIFIQTKVGGKWLQPSSPNILSYKILCKKIIHFIFQFKLIKNVVNLKEEKTNTEGVNILTKIYQINQLESSPVAQIKKLISRLKAFIMVSII